MLMDDEIRISIHAPHEGERRILSSGIHASTNFNPRSPRGGATVEGVKEALEALFQSTLPTRGSDGSVTVAAAAVNISIHAPHEGERHGHIHRHAIAAGISIHAPHEGERRRKSAFVCSISANLLNIIHCGTVTRAVSRRRIALFRLFSVRRSDVFMYAYASH